MNAPHRLQGCPPLNRFTIAKAMRDARAVGNPQLPWEVRSTLPRFTGQPVREEIGRARLATRLRFLGASSVCLWVAIGCAVYFGAQLVRGAF